MAVEALEEILSNCTLSANSASRGGGISSSTANGCTLAGNMAFEHGGGADLSTLVSCTLSNNSSADAGAGVANSTVNNCVIANNSASSDGGGVLGSTLSNCALTANSAVGNGAGAKASTLNNCTLTGNSAGNSGGGADASTLNNSILYYNSATWCANYSGSTLNYCCTTPLALSGTGDITAEPQLVDSSHLAATSPCRAAGSTDLVSGTDIDGEAWADPPSIGCDEFVLGQITGSLAVVLQASYTNVAPGFAVNLSAQIAGHAAANRWDFGDGIMLSNQPYASHAWASAGDYTVVFSAYNETYPAGTSATLVVHVIAEPIHHVSPDSLNPMAPYDSWATAATNIQDAVDAASLPGALVLVTNGTYQTGGRVVYGSLTNRVVVTKLVVLQSINGPAVTVIQGYPASDDGAVRCVYLTNGAVLAGFTLTNGSTRSDGDWTQEQSGGGVFCQSSGAVVSNCVLVANRATQGGGAHGGVLNNCTLSENSAGPGGGGGASWAALNNCVVVGNSALSDGGGVSSSTLNNCVLTANSSAGFGGGAENSVLNNSTLTGNSAGTSGGGADASTLKNSIIYYNSAPSDTNCSSSTLDYCCTTPLPVGGSGNIASEPGLTDTSHLGAGSPCQGAANGDWAVGVDIDGQAWPTRLR